MRVFFLKFCEIQLFSFFIGSIEKVLNLHVPIWHWFVVHKLIQYQFLFLTIEELDVMKIIPNIFSKTTKNTANSDSTKFVFFSSHQFVKLYHSECREIWFFTIWLLNEYAFYFTNVVKFRSFHMEQLRIAVNYWLEFVKW